MIVRGWATYFGGALFLYISKLLFPYVKHVFGRYEFQIQYGSIHRFVGATLGYAQATPAKHVIACIGDGSF